MAKQLFIGLAAEGSTDLLFLKSVVQRTFRQILFDQSDSIVDVEVFELKGDKIGKTFKEFVASTSKEGVEKYGILVLAVHSDSDKETLEERMQDKFIPAINYLNEQDEDTFCKVLTPIIPIRMIEAWMLADTSLLKEQIGTTLTDRELGLYRAPESIADPKRVIIDAIAKAEERKPKKSRGLSIGDLYGIIGDKISLDSLRTLSSYNAFYSFAENSLRTIRYV